MMYNLLIYRNAHIALAVNTIYGIGLGSPAFLYAAYLLNRLNIRLNQCILLLKQYKFLKMTVGAGYGMPPKAGGERLICPPTKKYDFQNGFLCQPR